MDHLFISKVDVVRPTKVSDGKGGFNESRTTTYANLPCRINWSRGQEKIMIGRETYFRDAKLYCRVITLEVDDIIVYNGIDYDIVNYGNVDNAGKYMILDIKLIE